MLPHAIPGIGFAFALLIAGIMTAKWFPWVPFYNTVWIIVAGNVLNRLSYATRITNAALIQVQQELEDLFVGFGYRVAEGPEVETDCRGVTRPVADYTSDDEWRRQLDRGRKALARDFDRVTLLADSVNVVRASQEAEVDRIIYFQTGLSYGIHPDQVPIPLDHAQRGGSSYAITKTAGEHYVELSGLDYVTFRIANIYGPRNRSGPAPTFYSRLSKGQPCFVVDSRRDQMYVEDMIDLFVMAVNGKGHGAYHVSSGSDRPVKDMFDLIVEDAKRALCARVAKLNSAPTVLGMWRSSRAKEYKIASKDWIIEFVADTENAVPLGDVEIHSELNETAQPGYRGAPYLVRDEEGKTKCVSCQLCEFVCPPKAIKITPPGPDGQPADRANAEKMPQEFEINMLRCIFCGLCAEVDRAIRMTNQCELATRGRAALKLTAKYHLNPDGTHERLLDGPPTAGTKDESLEAIGRQLQSRIQSVLGRSLHIREVDAGSCNGCELEIHALNNAFYDLERFGIRFVASPRHADVLLVTGPVTKNMREALERTYAATPDPKWVVAVGDCALDGGLFAGSYAVAGGVREVVPVDLHIRGCPPSPQQLLEGLLALLPRRS